MQLFFFFFFATPVPYRHGIEGEGTPLFRRDGFFPRPPFQLIEVNDRATFSPLLEGIILFLQMMIMVFLFWGEPFPYLPTYAKFLFFFPFYFSFSFPTGRGQLECLEGHI